MLTYENVLSNFELKTRPNGETFYTYRKDDDFKDLIQELHEGRFPNDFIFEFCHSAVTALIDSNGDIDDAVQCLNVFADNRTLCEWLLQFGDDFEAMRDGYGIDSTASIFSLLLSGYGYHMEKICHAVAEWYENQNEG